MPRCLWLAIVSLITISTAAFAGPTTIKIISEGKPATNVEVWVYDIESGEKLRYGITNDVGEVEFPELEKDGQYQARTVDDEHQTEVFTGGSKISLDIQDSDEISPAEEPEPAKEEKAWAPPGRNGWGIEGLVGIGGGVDGYSFDAKDPADSGRFNNDKDSTAGMGSWRVGATLLVPSKYVGLKNIRPFIGAEVGGLFGNTPSMKYGGTDANTGRTFTEELEMKTDVIWNISLGVVIPLELFGKDVEIQPLFGFGMDHITIDGETIVDNGTEFSYNRSDSLFFVMPGVKASMPVWSGMGLEVRGTAGFDARVYIGDKTWNYDNRDGASLDYGKSFGIDVVLGLTVRWDDLF